MGALGWLLDAQVVVAGLAAWWRTSRATTPVRRPTPPTYSEAVA